MPGRLTPPPIQQRQPQDSYDYARSPVEQGINTLFDTAQQMYRQKAEYNWQLGQMQQQEAIKRAQRTQAQEKIDLTGQLLEERIRHQKETEATAKANLESQAGYRTGRLERTPTQEQKVELANINGVWRVRAAAAGPSITTNLRREMYEGTTVPYETESGQVVRLPATTQDEKIVYFDDAGNQHTATKLRIAPSPNLPRKGNKGKPTIEDIAKKHGG